MRALGSETATEWEGVTQLDGTITCVAPDKATAERVYKEFQEARAHAEEDGDMIYLDLDWEGESVRKFEVERNGQTLTLNIGYMWVRESFLPLVTYLKKRGFTNFTFSFTEKETGI